MLDLVEEALDKVASLIEMLRETDWVFSVAFGRDVRPGAPFGDGVAQGVGVVALVSQQHRVLGQTRDQFRRAFDIALLPGREFELQRTTFSVDERVDFRREAASGVTQTSIIASSFRPLFAVAPC